MEWKKTTWHDWDAWESGAFRILKDDIGYALFLDKRIATDAWSGFATLEEAQQKAEQVKGNS
jgi:hypothetical protein